APDAAPTGKTSERVKERLCLYSFYFLRQSNLWGYKFLQINGVQAVHRRVMRKLCNAFQGNRESSMFMGYLAVSHRLFLFVL
ncbi:MAG TPA: hypothetical protein VF953_06190, partial [Terriglobales bacterium]